MDAGLFASALRKKKDGDPYAGINSANYAALTSNNTGLQADFRPLNFDNLLARKAVRVTNRGLDDGSFDEDPSKGFSLVSGYNDAVAGEEGKGTRAWRDNPMFHAVVREMFSQRPRDIGSHKYMQIVQSARDMGLTDDDIYLPQQREAAAVIEALRKKRGD